jgi:hypothetical protein
MIHKEVSRQRLAIFFAPAIPHITPKRVAP